LTGNSTGQSPSGIRGTGPLVGPPELNKSLGGCGLGDAEALLGGDRLLLRGGVLGGGLLAGGGVLVGGLLVGGGVGMVLEGGMLADALLEAVALLVDALLLAEALPPPTSTGVSSLAGSS
jgi:hypothetical protein